MEIISYLRYCPPESLFFDEPALEGGRFSRSDSDAPDGWVRRTDSEWVNILSPRPLPPQGWKVHVSATPASAQEVLETCWSFCVQRGISFKFLKSAEAVFLRSSKYGDRSASGKFVTIYPTTDDELTETLVELDRLLEGHVGPSILSDVRWRKGPLYVRYGAFHLRPMRTETGERVWAVEDPEGRLVPDERRPGFHPPPWVTLPDVVEQAVADRSRGRLDDFPYRPRRALHFSNGGGVYVAVDSEGREFLMKEARPYAGLDGSGADAVARLEGEAWAYAELKDLPEVPALHDHRLGHEHHFLVRDLVDGEPLVHVARSTNPLLRGGADPAAFAEYAAWTLDVVGSIEKVLRQMHDRGVLFGDLHPSNILITPTGDIRFIDLEGAFPVGEDRAQALGAPGYIAPETFRGAEIDEYALAVMTLDLFVPMARIISWDAGKAQELVRFIEQHFPVPDDFAAGVLRGLRLEAPRFGNATQTATPLAAMADLTPTTWPDLGSGEEPEPWRTIAAELADGILAMATTERSDRLYPGDPRQFFDAAGGITFAHGAAGVLWTLTECGVALPDSHATWFREAVGRQQWERPGFGDGLSGVALAQGALGDHESALESLREAHRLVDRWTRRGIHDGLAGIALAALDLDRLAPGAGFDEIADAVTDRLGSDPVPDAQQPVEPGLWRGEAGPALLFLRQHDRTGDDDLLDLATASLRRDLAALDQLAATAVDIVDRMPFLASGSGGLALVADRLLRKRSVPELEALRDRVRSAVTIPFVDEVGLFWGHAGLMIVAAELGGPDDGPTRTRLVAHARTMRLHSVGLKGAPAVTGRFNLRISADFATGAAGVLLGLHRIAGRTRMPLL